MLVTHIKHWGTVVLTSMSPRTLFAYLQLDKDNLKPKQLSLLHICMYIVVDTISSLQFFALLALVLFVCVSVCLCIRNYNFEFIFISLMDLKLLKHEFENPKQNWWPHFVIDQFMYITYIFTIMLIFHVWIISFSWLFSFSFSFVVSLN